MLKKKYVNVSAANLYRLPTFHSEVDSQAVLWEQVEVSGQQDDFVQVICEDSYQGWIHSLQLAEGQGADLSSLKMISKHVVQILQKPAAGALPLRDAVAGSYILGQSKRKGWLRVQLPDGEKGWLPEESCAAMPPFSRANMIRYARTFLGTPYHWAGKTPKGLDCSGFSQLVHKMFGIKIRRDASMQFEDACPVSRDPLEGKPGDLMFFAESGSKITHVGFCLGKGQILHARGLVRINSLRREATGFDNRLLNNFVEIRSFID